MKSNLEKKLLQEMQNPNHDIVKALKAEIKNNAPKSVEGSKEYMTSLLWTLVSEDLGPKRNEDLEVEMLKFLLKQGAEVNISHNRYHDNALEAAYDLGNPSIEIAKTLIHAGAKITESIAGALENKPEELKKLKNIEKHTNAYHSHKNSEDIFDLAKNVIKNSECHFTNAKTNALVNKVIKGKNNQITR